MGAADVGYTGRPPRSQSMPTRVLALLLAFAVAAPAAADYTSKHRRELKDVRSHLVRASRALRKDDAEAAKTEYEAAKTKFDAIVADAGIPRDHVALRSTLKELEEVGEDVGVAPAASPDSGPAAGGVSFVADVAPVLSSRCLRCHNDRRTEGGLNLATFANMKAGGDSGPLVVIGNPADSPLFTRCADDDPELRMPKGGQLQDAELAAIRDWISGGAAFDGDGEAVALGRLKSAGSAGPAAEVVVPEPKGTETVSFTRDIGPMLDRICLGCHSGNNPTGGLSMTTFAGLMRGGDSGPVIRPGDAENSRLFRLVGGLELPRMPGNQSRIRRSEYAALKTWFEEGNTFDGPDADALITTYILTPERKAAMARADRSAAEWHEAREASSEALWQKAMRLIDPQFAAAADVFAAGNADDLESLTKVAQEQLDALTAEYGSEHLKTRGLSLLAITTSYGHKEIGRSLAGRDPGGPFHGHHGEGGETLYAAVDTSLPSEATLSVEDRVRAAVTAAFVSSLGEGVPTWLSEGVARATIAPRDSDPAAQAWARAGASAMRRVSGADVLQDGSYAEDDRAAAGYVIVRALSRAGGEAKLKAMLTAIAGGAEPMAAMEQAYGPAAAIGAAVSQ